MSIDMINVLCLVALGVYVCVLAKMIRILNYDGEVR